MTGVNEGQKKAMGEILAAMNCAISNTPASSSASKTLPSASGGDDAKVAAMGEIMARFRSATDNIRETAQHDDVLMEALQTERTEAGVRISEWEIAVTEQTGRPGKFYSITNTVTGSEIANDLRLYEAARMLTQELNKGASITSAKIRKILRLEEDFSKNLEDAARFAHIAKNSSGEKKMIAEDRYSDAKSKAILAKEQIKNVR